MTISAISSSALFAPGTPSINSQQAGQTFQSLAQQLRSSEFGSPQSPALPQPGLPGFGTPTPTKGTATLSGSTGTHLHFHHIHAPASDDADSDAPTSTSPFGELGQALQAGNSSAAQQAYGNLSQDLQQVALNRDLLSAQSAALQSSDLSVTI